MVSVLIDRKAGLSSASAYKGPCFVATIGNITLAGIQTIDGETVAVGNRVLVKNQTNPVDNGIYIVDTGNWKRSADFSRNDDVVKGTRVVITDGDAYAYTTWQVGSLDPIDIGNSDIEFGLTYGEVYRVYYDQNGLPLVDGAGRYLISDARLAPTSASAPGVKGDLRFDSSFLYVCVATNTWKRVGLSTW